MIEVSVFGWIVAELASAVSMVLVIVALSSVTYLAMTLAPVLGLAGRSPTQRRARALGISVFVLSLVATVAGLRVGGSGRGGELVPTLALGVAASSTFGAVAVLAALGAGASAARLASEGSRRKTLREGKKAERRRRLAAAKDAHADGEDVSAEVADAEAALLRLTEALDKLASTGDAVTAKLDALGDEAAAGDLGRQLARTRAEVTEKLDVGRRIEGAARDAAFRLACAAPVRRLLRRRPRDLGLALSVAHADDAHAGAALSRATVSIDRFLGEAEKTRGELAALEGRRPPQADDADPFEDPWGQAMRDLAAIEDVYHAVHGQLGLVSMRLSARTEMEAVARAAGEVSDKARASGIPASDLQDLVDELTRAESAIRMATPPELDARSLTDALARGATALDRSDGASLDELLRALREVV